jgi:hypothetical protein
MHIIGCLLPLILTVVGATVGGITGGTTAGLWGAAAGFVGGFVLMLGVILRIPTKPPGYTVSRITLFDGAESTAFDGLPVPLPAGCRGHGKRKWEVS